MHALLLNASKWCHMLFTSMASLTPGSQTSSFLGDHKHNVHGRFISVSVLRETCNNNTQHSRLDPRGDVTIPQGSTTCQTILFPCISWIFCHDCQLLSAVLDTDRSGNEKKLQMVRELEGGGWELWKKSLYTRNLLVVTVPVGNSWIAFISSSFRVMLCFLNV